MQEIINLNSATVEVSNRVDEFSDGFNKYLSTLDLPTCNVLIEKDERLVVIENIPRVVKKLDKEKREEAMYISKFIAACGAGLFDAALNFLWNETILNLRRKVIRFDLDYFLDSTIQDSRKRASIKSEEDLKKIDDWELIKGCKDTGIITEIGYKHLDYIRDMRNYASAAHPNQNNIDGLQVSSWLQTCIKEVLSKEPEGPVIEIKKLIYNIRNKELTTDDTPIIVHNITKLPEDLVDSLLRAIFGMYCTVEIGVSIKNNVKLIAKDVWNNSSNQAKCDTALKYAIFAANGEVEKRRIANEFLSLVNGLAYLPNDQKIADMDEKLNLLYTAHYGYNNFYNEPIYAKELVKYIPETGEIPKLLEEKYIKYVLLCRLGNPYGVSEGALPYYEKMISLFKEEHFAIFCKLLMDSDIQNSVRNDFSGKTYLKLADTFFNITVNEHLKEILKYISENSYKALSLLSNTNQYKQLIKKI
ncbi:hypothetical protein OQL12_003065 [Clostridium perfringens]|jgi:hypothetical protein|nr:MULTISPECIES: hypothetical protein [Bacillota]MDU4264721.1 hypothetical protein [Bifidobacterium breve]EDT25475.1 conserved hypothetical protein [Clostridium perfringens CPE str. F4969]EGT0682102.1 hypothetical protein [Clostridium perfringens]EGT0684796.1 hypothetical protein [Clostridium perfringens]EGT0687624.1 hypothetical protein [Clostridium perfringens]